MTRADINPSMYLFLHLRANFRVIIYQVGSAINLHKYLGISILRAVNRFVGASYSIETACNRFSMTKIV